MCPNIGSTGGVLFSLELIKKAWKHAKEEESQRGSFLSKSMQIGGLPSKHQCLSQFPFSANWTIGRKQRSWIHPTPFPPPSHPYPLCSSEPFCFSKTLVLWPHLFPMELKGFHLFGSLHSPENALLPCSQSPPHIYTKTDFCWPTETFLEVKKQKLASVAFWKMRPRTNHVGIHLQSQDVNIG